MAVVEDTLPHCTGAGTEADPYIYTTAAGLLEAIDVANAYVEAGSENLVFDANTSNITKLLFKCAYIDGKGTTVRNLLVQNETKNLIETFGTNNILIENFNFYNMCILTNNTNQIARFYKDIDDHTVDMDGKTRTFNKCNFTGYVKGNAHTEGYLRSRDGYSFGAYYSYLRITNCTFNINLNLTNISYDGTDIFKGGSYDDPRIDNCTICISGNCASSDTDALLKIINNFKTINTVFMNKEQNKLTLDGDINIVLSMRSAEYSYFKMYIEGENPSTFTLTNGSKLLFNKSRYENYDSTNAPTCIIMQEDDDTAADYIYNASNLANAGFLVGQTIP